MRFISLFEEVLEDIESRRIDVENYRVIGSYMMSRDGAIYDVLKGGTTNSHDKFARKFLGSSVDQAIEYGWIRLTGYNGQIWGNRPSEVSRKQKSALKDIEVYTGAYLELTPDRLA